MTCQASCREGQEKVKHLSEARKAEELLVKRAVSSRQDLAAGRDALVKKLTTEEMLMHM